MNSIFFQFYTLLLFQFNFIYSSNKTYERLTYFIQGWVGSENFLNFTGECGGDCSFNKTIFNEPLDLVTIFFF